MATESQPVHYEDMVGVRSRISWGAVLAGSAVALGCLLVLTLFFGAVGLSLTAADVRSDAVNIGAIVAAVVSICISLWFGGWVASQLTAGENAREAAMYGIITWAVVTAFMLMLAGAGIRAGYFALVGGAMVAENTPAAQQPWDQALRDAGVSETTIEGIRAQNPSRLRAQMDDPATRDRVKRAAVIASWSTLAGTLLAIGSAVCGAMVGRGPAFRLFPVATGRRQEIIIAR